MASNTTGQNLPPPQSPFVDLQHDGVLSNDGYQFLMDSVNRAASAVPTASVEENVAAAGLTQATATQLTSQWSDITSGAGGGTGGVLLAPYSQGQTQTVFNDAGANINVYPPAGSQIDALGANAPFVLANGARQTFDFVSGTQIRT